jgi:hypothetical protein
MSGRVLPEEAVPILLNEQEQRALDLAQSFEGVGGVALSMLARHAWEGHTIVMICGPMTTGGCEDFEQNMRRFRLAIEVAIRNGLVVFDQILFQEALIRVCGWKDGDPYPEELLTEFYGKIFASGYISRLSFLPDWHTSRGAKWERKIAQMLRIPTEEYPTEWLVLIQENQL